MDIGVAVGAGVGVSVGVGVGDDDSPPQAQIIAETASTRARHPKAILVDTFLKFSSLG